MLPSTLKAKSVTSISTQIASPDTQLPSSLTTDYVKSHDTVELRFDLIEHLNLDEFLERTNEVTVPTVFPPILGDSESSDSEDSGNSLMEELLRLSRMQQNAAAPEPKSPIDLHSPGTSGSPKHRTHDIGVMSGPSVTSTGVTASLDPSTPSRSKDTVFLDLRRLEGKTPTQVIT